MAKIPKKLLADLKILAENDKLDDFKQEGMFGRMVKIPIANAFSESVEMDFVDYGDYATFRCILDTFRASAYRYYRG